MTKKFCNTLKKLFFFYYDCHKKTNIKMVYPVDASFLKENIRRLFTAKLETEGKKVMEAAAPSGK